MISDKKRVAAINPIVLEAERIYRAASNIPEISELNKEVEKEHMVVVGPYKDGSIKSIATMETKGNNESPDLNQEEFRAALKIYPFFKEDAVFGTFFKECSFHDLGAYGCYNHTIMINMETPETTRFQAHTLLHELQHAMRAKKEKRVFSVNVRSNRERMIEETKIWTVDYKILLAMGGKDYEREAKETADQIYDCWVKKFRSNPLKKDIFWKPLTGQRHLKHYCQAETVILRYIALLWPLTSTLIGMGQNRKK